MPTLDSPNTYTGIPDLGVSLDGDVLSVTFNRPDSLNSLNAAMLRTAADTLERAASDPRVKVVRLSGPAAASVPGRGSVPTIRHDAPKTPRAQKF